MVNDEITIAQNERFLLQKEYLGENKPINQIQPIVSVTVATYQHVNYIKQCLDGILMQKTDFPYEIILGEDGSVDGTQEICKEYAEKYPDKIRLFIRDRKLSQYIGKDGKVTRFNGIWNRMSARGKYIAWCEGDDYWIDPLKLQKQVDFLESHPNCGLVYTDVNFYFQVQGTFMSNYIASNQINRSYSFIEHLENAGYIAPCTWLYRRELMHSYVDKNYVDTTFPLALDIWAKSMIKFMPDVTAVYRVLDESASHSLSLKKMYHFSQGVFQIQKDYIEKYKNIVSDKKRIEIYLNSYSRMLTSAIVLNDEIMLTEVELFIKNNLIFSSNYLKVFLLITMQRNHIMKTVLQLVLKRRIGLKV